MSEHTEPIQLIGNRSQCEGLMRIISIARANVHMMQNITERRMDHDVMIEADDLCAFWAGQLEAHGVGMDG